MTMIDVTSYGAVGDGSTDNASAFNAVSAAITDGCTVFFPPSANAYLTSSPLTITKNNVTVYSSPESAQLSPTASSTSVPLLINSGNTYGVKIYGLTLYGGGESHTGTGDIIQSYKDTELVYEQCRFQNSSHQGALISDGYKCGFVNCKFEYIGNLWKSSGAFADRFAAITFSTDSGQADTYSWNYVTGCYFENVGLDCVSVGGSNNFHCTDNRFNPTDALFAAFPTAPGGAYGGSLFLNGVVGAVVTGNIAGSRGFDIETVSHLVCSGNQIVGSVGPGISFVTCNYGTIAGNTCLNNVRSSSSEWLGGININANNSYLTLTGNVCSDDQATKTQQYGLHTYGPGTQTNVWIDQSNCFDGNVSGRFGAASGGTAFVYSLTR